MSPSGSSTQIAGTSTAARPFWRRASRSNAAGTNTDAASLLLSRMGGVTMTCLSGADAASPRTGGFSMDVASRRAHWENVYITKGEDEVSWFQESATRSLELIDA